jgi:hypothetical protein
MVIDVHHHMLPDFFWREINDQHAPVGGIAPAPWSRESSLVHGRGGDRCRGGLYWDTALSWHDSVLQMLRAVVGIDRVLFGTDFPYFRRDLAIAGRRELAQTKTLDDAERKKVFGETARGLLPRLVR